jgi:diguanylate cyclase (GGDEF)-like protein/PAS domain S-box-containing protein
MNGLPVQARVRLALNDRIALLSTDDSIEDLLGFSAGLFRAGEVSLCDLIHRDDADVAAKLFSVEPGNESGTVSLRLRHIDGRIRCIRGTYSKSLTRSGDKILELLLEDVASLHATRIQPARLTTIEPMMDFVGEVLYFKNRDHVFTAMNQAARRIFCGEGLAGPDPVGKTDYDLFPECYADISYRLEKEVIAGADVATEIHATPFSTPSKKWLNSLKYAVRGPGGDVIGLFGVAHDITNHRLVQERLYESQEMLRDAQSIAGIGAYHLDFATGLWTSSDLLDQIFGIGGDYDRSVEGWVMIVHPDDRASMSDYFNIEVASKRKPFNREYRIVRRSDGEVRWVHGMGRLELDTAGKPLKMTGTIRDITELKQNELALRESRELLGLFIEHAPAAIAMFDRDMRYLAVSRRWIEIHELEGQQVIGRSHYEIFPNLPQGWREHHRRALGGETITPGEETFNLANGTARWIHRELRPWRNGNGEISGIVIFSEDITERKKTEAALRESREILQLLVENAPVAIAMFDRNMRYLAASHCWMVDHSVTAAEIIGHSHYKVNPDVPDRWKETHRRGLAGERQASQEDCYLRADGSVQWIRWEILPWHASDGLVGGIIMFYEDITHRKQAESALRGSKQLLELFIEHVPAAIAMFDRNMCYLAASHRWMKDNELEGRQIIGRSHYDFAVDIPDRWKQAHHRGLLGETSKCDEDAFERPDGTVQWVRWEVVPWREGDGSVGGIILFAEDITQHRDIEHRLRLAASVFTNASEGITITDPDGVILEVNEMFTKITGYQREEVLGKNPRILKSGVQSDEFYSNMWRSLVNEGSWSGEIWNRNKSGETYAESLNISAVRDKAGKIQQYVAMFSDITQIKKHEQQLEHLTYYDALTSLPNRVLLADRLQQAMGQANRRKQHFAVAYLDLDGFKTINDLHGRDAGDRLLNSLAFNMKCALREGDTLARLGGDEFVAVILDLDDVASSMPILDQLLEAASERVQVGELNVGVSASIGVTFYPQLEEADPDLLLRQADQAMYQAKLAGGNRHHLFDPNHDQSVRGRHENLEHIRRAMAAHEFVLHYQPKVNMRTGKIVGLEALIRWNHPDRGLLPPGMFLPVIEDHSLAIELGEWVIEKALTQMDEWRAAGFEVPVSVNVGALQLQQADFVDRLSLQLARHPDLKPFSLEIEVLETSALQDITQTSQILKTCHGLGVQFALDDFGTGYSSLTYLKRLPVSVLKIDQSFVSDMLEEPENLSILEGILSLASAFHRQVIAEGVETVEHGLMLLQLGCELAQGYGIARPMPAAEVVEWAVNWKPDQRWSKAPSVNAGNKALLYACVEHRAWLAAFESYLMGKRHAPPAMDQGHCMFGKWIESEKKAGRGSEPCCCAVDAAHTKFHALANEVLLAQSQGRVTGGLSKLADLHSICDQFMVELESTGSISGHLVSSNS